MVALHAELAGLLRHHLGEARLAAGDMLGHGHGHVVARLGDQRLDGVEQRDLGALLDVELGGLGRDGVGREADLGAVGEAALLDQLEHEIERHQLGERGRIAQVVGGALVEDAAGVGVDDQHGVPAVHLRMGRRQRAR